MAGQGKLFTGVVVGAGAMYLLDPDRGARRRSLLRDQGIHASHKVRDGFAGAARDARNRTAGVAAQVRSRIQQDRAGDDILTERVRSAIGRAVSHPGAITVNVFEGRVTLGGHVLADELPELIRRVGRVRGVSEVGNELEMHATAENVPSLQGIGHRRQLSQTQGNLRPVTRLLLGTAGSLLAAQGVRKGGTAGAALSAVGAGLLAGAVGFDRSSGLVGFRSRKSVEVEKTLSIGAPVEVVWEVWSNFENFPRFMAHLREVRKIDEGHSRWVAVGPGGVSVEWDAIVTDWVPKQFIGWTSIEGSEVATTGQVRFRRASDTQTEIDIRLEYAPPAGVLGHEVASLFGDNPKQAMDEDLARLKSLLEMETGRERERLLLEDTASTESPPRSKRPGRPKRKP
ncbi:MAG TPA: SRPBCC family protein [Gemmatimonadales bacterium]|nr:SRPBCC family protein [Gemmatimonadales bacterium]